MAWSHITTAKRTVKQLLADRLPLKLAEADGLAGDGIRTPPPFEIYTTDKANVNGYPSLELIITDSTPQGVSLVQYYRHRVVIGVTVGSDDEEVVAAYVERYLWSLRQVCRDTHLIPFEGTAPLETGGEQYTPLVQRPETVETPFIKGAFIEVFITTLE